MWRERESLKDRHEMGYDGVWQILEVDALEKKIQWHQAFVMKSRLEEEEEVVQVYPECKASS